MYQKVLGVKLFLTGCMNESKANGKPRLHHALNGKTQVNRDPFRNVEFSPLVA